MKNKDSLRDFLKLNKTKALSLWLAIPLIIVCGIGWFFAIDDSTMSRAEITYLVVVPVVCILLLCLCASGVEYYLFMNRLSLFNEPGLASFLKQHNFSPVVLYQRKKVTFTVEGRTGFIGKYPVVINIRESRTAYVVFSFRLTVTQVPEDTLDRFIAALKPLGGVLGWDCVTVLMKRKQATNTAFVNQTLSAVAALLAGSGFVPAADIDFNNIDLSV